MLQIFSAICHFLLNYPFFPCRNDLCKTNDCVNFFFASVVKNGCFQHSTLTLLTKFIATSQSYPLYFSLLIKYILIKNLRDKTTLITLLRIPYLCHFGSSSFVLPIRPKYGILNRVIRVNTQVNFVLLHFLPNWAFLIIIKSSWGFPAILKALFHR